MSDYARTVLDMLRGTHAPRTAPIEPPPDVMKAAQPAPHPAQAEPRNITPPRERQAVRISTPSCEHQWQWKGGVKSCWLCGASSDKSDDVRSRRDSTTTWQAKVYGGKR